MLKRKIEDEIREHLQGGDKRMLILEGARQVGKTFIIRYIGQDLFRNYIEINMEDDYLGERLFAGARTVKDFYLALSSIAGDKMG